MAEPSFDDRFNNELPDYVSLTPVEGNPFTAKVAKATNRLLGLNGEERYQTWPERMVRSGLTAPYDALTGRLQVNDPETNMPTGEAIGRAGDVAGLAGSGGIGGTEGGAVLGSGPIRKPWELAGLKEKPESWDRVLPAVQDIKSGKIRTAKRGGEHVPILQEHYPEAFIQEGRFAGDFKEDWDINSKFKTGYYDPKTKKFEDRLDENSPYYLVDSTSLSPRFNRQRGDFLYSDTQKPGMVMSSIMNANEKAPPFFSALEHAVESTKQAKMPADQWLGTISNSKGVKPEELDWTGFKDFLAEKGKQPVTKAEVQEHLNNNRVELKEVNKGNYKNWTEEDSARLDELEQRGHRITDEEEAERQALITRENEATRSEGPNASGTPTNLTKYSQYQLPGGENYREMLLTLPTNIQSYDKFTAGLKNKYGDMPLGRMPLTEVENNQLNKFYAKEDSSEKYQSSHWDEPNILAHVRMNDRAIEGKKSLHLEEIQSDWHQQGREKGYREGEKAKIPFEDYWKQTHIQDYENAHPSVQEAARREYERLGQNVVNQDSRVPDAPFKKSWHELALKRMIREAAEKGYDRLSWTPGEAQAARYDLSKQVDSINLTHKGDNKHITINAKSGVHASGTIDQNGKLIQGFDAFKGNEGKPLSDLVGKEMAEKLMKTNENKIFEGEGLRVGGEGMKGFYDQIIPKAIEKIGKEHGVKVKTTNIKVKDETRDSSGFPARHPKDQPVHYIDIPESLKNAALGKGFPLFSSGLPLSFHPVDGNPFEDKK